VDGFFFCSALTNITGQAEALCYPKTIFTRIKDNLSHSDTSLLYRGKYINFQGQEASMQIGRQNVHSRRSDAQAPHLRRNSRPASILIHGVYS